MGRPDGQVPETITAKEARTYIGKSLDRPEDKIQGGIVTLLRIFEAQGKLLWFAVPNGGKRSKTEAAIMKGLGVRAGVPDLCIMISDGPVLFLEVKSEIGRATPEQRDWIDKINDCSWTYAFIVRSVDDAHARIKWAIAEALV